jgi:polyhydroxyalkanoate synthesis regulator phasin
MHKEVKKALLAGLGILGFSMDKASEAVSALVARGEITAEQGKKVIREIAERGSKDTREMGRKIEDAVRQALKKVTFVTRPQMEKLESRLAALEKRMRSTRSRSRRAKTQRSTQK